MVRYIFNVKVFYKITNANLRGGHDNESDSEIVMLAPVSVHADYRQGIGTAMLKMGIEKVHWKSGV